MDNLFNGTFLSKEKMPEDMDNRELLVGMFKRIDEIYQYTTILKHNYDKIVSTIEVDSATLKNLLGMSDRTLSRWRSQNKIRYYVRQDGCLYYKFEELYIDVKSGRLSGKTFSADDAIERMNAYYHGLLKGNNKILELDATAGELPR